MSADNHPANDNDYVRWWEQVFPAALGLVILTVAIRVALAGFF
jgi:hypothetical protein